MYYHVRLKKILHNGSWEDSENQEWDFRSLNKALTLVKRDFDNEAQAWRLEDLTVRTPNLMALEPILEEALLSVYQHLILTFKDDSPLLEKYDHYEFLVVVRDENERPPMFSFAEVDEAAIN